MYHFISFYSVMTCFRTYVPSEDSEILDNKRKLLFVKECTRALCVTLLDASTGKVTCIVDLIFFRYMNVCACSEISEGL
jgi:hypothetical protein